MKTWYFELTGEAYDDCQCDDVIKNGDLLVIHNQNVIGVAMWPLAVTSAYADLHTPTDDITLKELNESMNVYHIDGNDKIDYIDSFTEAVKIANEYEYPVLPLFKDLV